MSPPDAEITELPSSPGARLRREREGRGMSQQQAAEALNLDPVILAYLEANDFAALGAPVFVKGHLRRYAALLGMNEDDLLLAYERSKQQLDEPTLVPKARLEMAPVRGKPRWPWVVGGAVLFLVASALIAYVSENGLPWVDDPAEELQSTTAAGNTTTAVPGATPATTSGAPAEGADTTADAVASANPRATPPAASGTPAAGAPATTGPAPFSSSSNATAAAPAAGETAVPPQGQVNLQLRFAADSWVEVFDGSGRAVLYDLGKAGSERTITAQAPVSVTLGDARGVAISVNGRTLPPPPRAPGETLARFSIGADGSLR
jgi:cytoskeleton protein RodZ